MHLDFVEAGMASDRLLQGPSTLEQPLGTTEKVLLHSSRASEQASAFTAWSLPI